MTESNRVITGKKLTKIIITPSGYLTSKMPPILLKKNSFKIVEGSNTDLLKRLNLESSSRSLFREEVLYTSKAGDFLGNTHSVTIVNRVNILTKSNRTVAKFSTPRDNLFFEKTSDSVTKLIGQKNYDTVFTLLKSVTEEELKVKGILSLLTLVQKFYETASQTEEIKFSEKELKVGVEDKIVQTEQSSIDYMFKPQYRKPKPFKRKHITTYIVKDTKKPTFNKVFLNTHTEREDSGNGIKENYNNSNEQHELSDLKNDVREFLHDDRSTDSDGSIRSTGNLSTASGAKKLLEIIRHQTNNPESILPDSSPRKMIPTTDSLVMDTEASNFQASMMGTMIRMNDGTDIYVPVKPEDHFHIATPKILSSVTTEEKIKLLKYQALIDYVFCNIRDEDGFLPIHTAVRVNDVTVLRRQCHMLVKKGLSVDEPACNMTALQMSLFNESPACLSILLGYGADPLRGDEEDRCLIHLAAEIPGSHLGITLRHCRQKARQILEDHEELWEPKFQSWSDEQLTRHLLDYICNSMDEQGYTPLMLASKAGLPDNVRLLAEASPSSVTKTMASCGNTALFLAVGEACLDAINSGNRQKVAENYKETIRILLEYGADPATENYSGSTVNDLLQEFNVNEINQLISKAFKVKNKDDIDDLEEDSLLVIKKEKDDYTNEQRETKDRKDKPVIIENIQITSANLNIRNSKGKSLKTVNPKDKIKKANNRKKRGNFANQSVNSCFDSNNETLANVKIENGGEMKIDVNKVIVNQSSVGNMVVHNNYYVNETANTSKAEDRKGQIASISAPVISSGNVKEDTGKRFIIIDSTIPTKIEQGSVLNLCLNTEQNVLGEFLMPKIQNSYALQSTNNEFVANLRSDDINNMPVVLVQSQTHEFNNELNVNNIKKEFSYVTIDNNEMENSILKTETAENKKTINILRLKRKNKSIQNDKGVKSCKKLDNT